MPEKQRSAVLSADSRVLNCQFDHELRWHWTSSTMSLCLGFLGCHICIRVGLSRIGLGIQEGGGRGRALKPCLA